jgi:mono/diheme cytochrome c family protein
MRDLRGIVVAAVLTSLAVYCLGALLQPDPGRRNYALFPEMAQSRAVESFAPSAALPGGRGLQPLVSGVVPRGTLALGFGPGADEAERAGVELHSPLDADDAAAARLGARRYGIFCAVCHGPDGAGGGAAVTRGFPPPPSLLGARAVALPDGALFHVITHGQGLMGPFAAEIPVEDRWRIVLHMRRLQEAAR